MSADVQRTTEEALEMKKLEGIDNGYTDSNFHGTTVKSPESYFSPDQIVRSGIKK